MIGGKEADERADRLVRQIFAVFRDAGGAGLAGDPILEAVDPGGKTRAVLDDAHHHLLHLLRRLRADDLADDPRLNRVPGPIAVNHLIDDVGPDQVATGGGHVDGGQHLDRGRVHPLAKGGGCELRRLPLREVTERGGRLRCDVDPGG